MKTAYFNRFSIDLPEQCVSDCSGPGPADESIAHWAPILFFQHERDGKSIDPALVRAELQEYGAWDDDELSDDTANWARIIWCAACDIREFERELTRETGQ